ncbi:MAG: polyprenyl synthetase family protein [Nitrospira sp.]|nr:polyprenyl synthetase family protein [Nitrospira sp.]
MGRVSRRTRGVEEQIRKKLDSSVALVNTVAAHILNSGGKRVRPLFVLLSAHLCGYAGQDHQALGSLVEFIHTATLLHDDVVDDADLRRGAGPRAKSGATKSVFSWATISIRARSVRSSTSAIKG